MREAADTPKPIKMLISLIEGSLVEDPLPRNQQKNLCLDMMRYSSLRELVPAVRVMPTKEGIQANNLAAIIIDLLPAPKSQLDFDVYKQGFKTLLLQAS